MQSIQSNSNPYNELNGRSYSAVGARWFYAIPYQDQFIIYLPLKRLAFIGNKAMVGYCSRLYGTPEAGLDFEDLDIRSFLGSVGFFDPAISIGSFPELEEQFRPTVAVLLLTVSCNFRCVYCYASAGGERGRLLSLEAGKTAIDIVCENARLKKEQVFSLCFHGGGEPTLANSHLKFLVEYARNKEIPAHISLSTNGYWSGEEREWIFSNINDISLSCDGLAEIHDRQRPLASGAGSFAGVFDTILEMDRKKISYGIRLTVTETTVETLARSIEFLCERTGCTNFQAEPAFDHGRARADSHAVTSGERFVSAFLTAYDIARRYGRTLFYSGARPASLTDTFCTAPYNALIVNNEDKLTTCYEIFHSSLDLAPLFFIGEVTEMGFVNVDYAKRRRLLDTIKKRRELCKGCFCYWHCAGDCPAKTLTQDGNGHLQFRARCMVNRAITIELLVRNIHDAGGVWHGAVQAPSPFSSLYAVSDTNK